MSEGKTKYLKKYKDNDHPAVKKANKKATKATRKAKPVFEKKLADNIKQDKKSFYAYKCKSDPCLPPMAFS